MCYRNQCIKCAILYFLLLQCLFTYRIWGGRRDGGVGRSSVSSRRRHVFRWESIMHTMPENSTLHILVMYWIYLDKKQSDWCIELIVVCLLWLIRKLQVLGQNSPPFLGETGISLRWEVINCSVIAVNRYWTTSLYWNIYILSFVLWAQPSRVSIRQRQWKRKFFGMSSASTYMRLSETGWRWAGRLHAVISHLLG